MDQNKPLDDPGTTQWGQNPVPSLGEAFADLRPGTDDLTDDRYQQGVSERLQQLDAEMQKALHQKHCGSNIDPLMFVPRFYEMDPGEEVLIPEGKGLKDGMVVLIESYQKRREVDPTKQTEFSDFKKSPEAFESAKRWNRWMTISSVKFLEGDQVQEDLITFVGTFEDGTQKKYNVLNHMAWLAKIYSLPEEILLLDIGSPHPSAMPHFGGHVTYVPKTDGSKIPDVSAKTLLSSSWVAWFQAVCDDMARQGSIAAKTFSSEWTLPKVRQAVEKWNERAASETLQDDEAFLKKNINEDFAPETLYRLPSGNNITGADIQKWRESKIETLQDDEPGSFDV